MLILKILKSLGKLVLDKNNNDIEQIVSRIRTLDPYKIVLFGSRATRGKDSESDIDLLVVLDTERMSQSYEERMRRRLMVRNILKEINSRVAIELIIYTKSEYEYLQSQGAYFLKEIENSGKALYEKTG